ncbi:MAG: hypothetical protein RIT45_2638 [Pseudomonadota bacterium]
MTRAGGFFVLVGLGVCVVLAAARFAPVRPSSPTVARAAVPATERALPRRAGIAAAPSTEDAPAPAVEADSAAPSLPRYATLTWLAVGGGAGPDSTQASLEADIASASEVLGGQGALFFAAGAGRRVVAVAAPEAELGDDAPDGLRGELAALFGAERTLGLRYRPVQVAARPAEGERVVETLFGQLGRPGPPLLLVVSAHGQHADTADAVRLVFWGNGAWTPRWLAAELDRAGSNAMRPLRMVVGACYSGGFGELAFAGGDAKRALPPPTERCGLFASTWDLESSGCDPDPDRRAHEGYIRHFWASLRRQDREGRPLAAESIDFDGDGRISLLDAHTRVRVASTAFDVPTTTSERWLRVAVPTDAAQVIDASTAARLAATLPHELAVVSALQRLLRLEDPYRQAASALEERDALIAEAEAEETRASNEALDAADHIAGTLLAHWPNLADPWRSDFAPTLDRDGPAIHQALRGHPHYPAWQAARTAKAAAGRIADRALVARSIAERLLRAVDNLRLAHHLQHTNPSAWATFLTLRRCESHVPQLR